MGPKRPLPLPRNTPTPTQSMAVARSSFPSPSRSALTIALGGCSDGRRGGPGKPIPFVQTMGTGCAPSQAPVRQVSVQVQALPSLQAVPSGLFGLEQAPLAGSQARARGLWASAVQITGLPAAQE